ncbi:hypothetical protein [Fusibacter sp. 3D3]|uniref:hypothetical protein n=1 Tax=Fusibacter sp. 3D3 TaxID=1048380 RepID=UPI001586B3A9|nr:hypothetical protein [Fusibacter sp. 3D3]
MGKKNLSIFRCVVFLVFVMSAFGMISSAEVNGTGSVQMVLPEYLITIKGESIDNENAQYPLLNYNGITYIPLIYNLSRTLGVETTWHDKEGVAIETTGISCELYLVKSTQNNKTRKFQYRAIFPSFKVTINGMNYNSEAFVLKKKYPALLYNNLIYLPLTSEVAEALDLKLQFSVESGLSIENSNPKVENIDSVSSNVKYDEHSELVVVIDKKIYFMTPDRTLAMVSEEDGELAELFQLPEESNLSALEVDGGNVFLNVHIGGALMGSDMVYEILNEGGKRLISDSYNRVHEFDDFNIMYWAGPMPYPGNLTISRTPKAVYDVADYVPLGSKSVLYGWYWHQEGDSEGGTPSDQVYSSGDYIYLLGFDKMHPDYTSLYEVNAINGVSKKLIYRETKDIKRYGDYIYYISKDIFGHAAVYKYNMKTQSDIHEATSVSGISQYDVLGNNVYFTDDMGLLYEVAIVESPVSITTGRVYQDQSAPCEAIKTFRGDRDYLVITFGAEAQVPHRLLVLDKNGKIVFKTSDHSDIKNISIDNGNLYYMNSGTQHFCRVSLRDIEN